MDGAPAIEGRGFDNELCNSVYGIPNVNDATAYEHKAKFVVFMEKLKMLVDMLGLCCFVSIWNDLSALVAEDFSQLYYEATGDNKSAETLLNIAEKKDNQERCLQRSARPENL